MADLSRLCPQCEAPCPQGSLESVVLCPFCQFPIVELAGKYRLLRRLGQGGSGELFFAEHTGLIKDGERVVKIVPPAILEKRGMRERFWREVQVTSAISQRNPHIVRVYDDFGEIPGLGAFYVMEFLRGETLTEILAKPELPDLPWIVEMVSQLCEAIQEAHKEGIVHRDLKPDNLFFTDPFGRSAFLKILDFGIAKPFLETGDLPRLTQGILGTPAYIAPEQATQKPIDPRTDVYSIALIVYELLTGQIPFFTPAALQTTSPIEVISIRLTHPTIPPPHLVRPDRAIPPALSAVICQALSLSPDDRHPSALAFSKALAEAVAENPGITALSSPPDTPPVPRREGERPTSSGRSREASLSHSLDTGEVPLERLPSSIPPSAWFFGLLAGLLLLAFLFFPSRKPSPLPSKTSLSASDDRGGGEPRPAPSRHPPDAQAVPPSPLPEATAHPSGLPEPPLPPRIAKGSPLRSREIRPIRRKAVERRAPLGEIRPEPPPPRPSLCPAGYVFLQSQPRVVPADFLVDPSLRQRFEKRPGGLCLPEGLGSLGLERDGYELCRFEVGKEPIRLWLKEKDSGAVSDACLKP